MNPFNLKLNIGELSVQGIEGVNQSELGEVVENNLTDLFSTHGIPAWLEHGGSVSGLIGDAIYVTPASSTEVVGVQIANAVFKGLSQ